MALQAVSPHSQRLQQDSRTALKTSGSPPAGARRIGLGLARANSRSQASLDPRVVQNAARNLFDGAFRGIDDRYRIARKQGVGGAQFVGHLLTRRIAAFGAPFVTNLLETLGLDSQGIELATMCFEARRELAGLEVVFGERII